MKLLSPAGDLDSLKVAVNNGADEVYLGIKEFNARNIEGFNLETLKLSVDYAHIFGVRVFLAVNILFTDEEMQSALDLVVSAYNVGVDAVIVQDIGLISLINKHFPEIEIHASTQMGIHNLEGVRELEKLNVKRVVLARETPLEEVKRIRENSNIEIEYFVHGALCVCFSGNCYLSSYMFDASGNRGKCKQLCRLPYSLYDGNKKIKEGYLLSAKDFNMLNRLKDLETAGVTSLKIEGRARRPYYVGEITNAYRCALDNISNTQQIELAFNRGFTEGYFNGNEDIISNIQNHVGVEVGLVTKFNKGKKFNEVYFTTNRNISAKSTLKFFYEGVEVETLSAFDLKQTENGYKLTTTKEIQVDSKVNLIADFSLEQDMLNKKRKVNLRLDIIAKENQKLYAKTIVNGETIELYGSVLLKAEKRPLTKDELIQNFSKNEYFNFDINADLGSVFIVKSELNNFRREFINKIISTLTKKPEPLKFVKIKTKKSCPLSNYQFVENSVSTNSEITIYSPEEYKIEDVKKFIDECKKNNTKPVLNLPNFALYKDIKLLKEIVEKTKIAILINNLYALSFNTEKFAGGGLNIYNNYSALYYNIPYIKAEGDNYHKMPYMTMRHCPIKQHMNSNCANCKFKNNYIYKMQNGKELKLKRIKMSTCTFYLTD